MRYCFIDLNPSVLRQYPSGIARALSEADGDASFTFIYYEPVGELVESAFPAGSRFIFSGPPTVRHIRSLLKDVRPDVVIFTAQRIPDSAFASVARELGVPTVMFQHGLYIPFMRRDPFFLIRKALKVVRYGRYAAAIADSHDESRLRYVVELSKVFLRGKPYSDAEVRHELLNVDRVLLNGEYWREWHSGKYGYPVENQVVTGYPDFDQLGSIRAQPRSEALCYVAQTLVEDGRMPRRQMMEFLDVLGASLGDRQLIVKLHPRSDASLYSTLAERGKVSLSREILPNARGYIGHYSTYLVLVPFLSPALFLWEFDGHPIPDVLRTMASDVSSDDQRLRSFIRNTSGELDSARAEFLSQYFWHNPRGAYTDAASEIMSMARGAGTGALSAAEN